MKCEFTKTRTSIVGDSIKSLSLAYSLSDKEYEQRKTEGSANVLIADVPLGVSYSDFKKRIKQKAESLNFDYFERHYSAYANVGASREDLEAYLACLRATGEGLFIEPKGMADECYEIQLTFGPSSIIASNSTPPPVTGRVESLDNLKKESEDMLREMIERASFSSRLSRDIILMPDDPKKETAIQVAIGTNHSRTLILPPLKNDLPKTDGRRPIIISAADFSHHHSQRISVSRAYGYGVIQSDPVFEGKGMFVAAYNFSAATGGRYFLQIEYASSEARPILIQLNGKDVAMLPMHSTGGWDSKYQTRSSRVEVTVVEGLNILGILRGDGALPHIRTIDFLPAN